MIALLDKIDDRFPDQLVGGIDLENIEEYAVQENYPIPVVDYTDSLDQRINNILKGQPETPVALFIPYGYKIFAFRGIGRYTFKLYSHLIL